MTKTTANNPTSPAALKELRIQLEKELSDLSKKEREIRSKMDEIRQREQEAQDANVLRHIDCLLDIFAKHHIRKCSDIDLDPLGRCKRCTLLKAKKNQAITFNVELLIT